MSEELRKEITALRKKLIDYADGNNKKISELEERIDGHSDDICRIANWYDELKDQIEKLENLITWKATKQDYNDNKKEIAELKRNIILLMMVLMRN